MGSRANFIVIDNGTAKAYYEQWGALGCVYSFADGPAGALEALSETEPVEELMDWAFAEGGYLIDQDHHVAMVFGAPFEEDEAFAEAPEEMATQMRAINDSLTVGRQAYLEHIAANWRGWTIIWDDRGVDAFAAYLQSLGIATLKTQPPSYPESTAPPVTLKA